MLRLQVDVKINDFEVKYLVEKYYSLQVRNLTKIRAAYRVKTDQGVFAFKNAYKLRDISFINQIIQQLKQEGFDRIPQIILTNHGKERVSYQGESYYMEEWLTHVREVSPRSMKWLVPAGKALAHYHDILSKIPRNLVPASRDLQDVWFNDVTKAYNRIKNMNESEILNIENLKLYRFFKERLYYAISLEKRSRREYPAFTLCHGSLHHENIMIDSKKEVWLIDYERMAWDERVKDLAQLMEYHFPLHRWPKKEINQFIDSYYSSSQTYINDVYQLKARVSVTPKCLKYFFRYFANSYTKSDRRTDKLRRWMEKEHEKDSFLMSR